MKTRFVVKNNKVNVAYRDYLPGKTDHAKEYTSELTFNPATRTYSGYVWNGRWGPGDNTNYREYSYTEVAAQIPNPPTN